MMSFKIEIFIATFLFISGNIAPAIVTACFASVYYISMLKVNVIDKKYKGNWNEYIKSWFKNES